MPAACLKIKLSIASFVVVIACPGIKAQSPIATDRPAVTDSSVVVPRGSLQFENGLTETGSGDQRIFDFPETLLRFGVASKTELRLTVPDYLARTGMSSGFGDLAIGVKQQLGPTPYGFDVSLV